MSGNNKYNEREQEKRSDVVITSRSAFNLPVRIKSKYEWRIIGLMIMKMQSDFNGHRFDFKNGDLKNQKSFLDCIRMERRVVPDIAYKENVFIIFPMSYILDKSERGQNIGYESVKTALDHLSRSVSYENKHLKAKMFDVNDLENGIIWGKTSVIKDPMIIKKNGHCHVSFYVPDHVWDVLCQWEKGVYIFEISIFFKLKKSVSVLFYILFSRYRKEGEVTWSVDFLKKTFSSGEYNSYNNFKKKVLEEARKDLKENSPFYFECKEFVDSECIVPAGPGRGKAARFVKFKILYQPEKNPEVDKRISDFIEINKPEARLITDLLKEEIDYFKNRFCFEKIEGKNLVYIVKLKYYKNYGNRGNINWRNHPESPFYAFLVRLYETIEASAKEIPNIPGYVMNSIKNELQGYEPNNKTLGQELESEDSPRRIKEDGFKPSHEQDMIWLTELAQDREWKDTVKRIMNIKCDFSLCTALMSFRDSIIDHPGHKSKQDLSRHFRSQNSYNGLYYTDKNATLNDPLYKSFNLKYEDTVFAEEERSLFQHNNWTNIDNDDVLVLTPE